MMQGAFGFTTVLRSNTFHGRNGSVDSDDAQSTGVGSCTSSVTSTSEEEFDVPPGRNVGANRRTLSGEQAGLRAASILRELQETYPDIFRELQARHRETPLNEVEALSILIMFCVMSPDIFQDVRQNLYQNGEPPESTAMTNQETLDQELPMVPKIVMGFLLLMSFFVMISPLWLESMHSEDTKFRAESELLENAQKFTLDPKLFYRIMQIMQIFSVVPLPLHVPSRDTQNSARQLKGTKMQKMIFEPLKRSVDKEKVDKIRQKPNRIQQPRTRSRW